MRWMVQNSYRSISTKTLIFFMAAFSLGLLTQADSADYNDEPWPEPVYFPQRSDNPAGASTPATHSNKNTPLKEKKWHLFKKSPSQQGKEATNKEAPVVPKRESPQDPPSSPFPLLRLPQGILTEQGVIPSGIYLIQPEAFSEMPTQGKSPETLTLGLTQRNKVLLVFTATASASSSEVKNPSDTPNSPLQKRDPKQTEPLQAKITLSTDGKKVQIHYYDQHRWYESPEFPIQDSRQLLINY